MERCDVVHPKTGKACLLPYPPQGHGRAMQHLFELPGAKSDEVAECLAQVVEHCWHTGWRDRAKAALKRYRGEQ